MKWFIDCAGAEGEEALEQAAEGTGAGSPVTKRHH
jgi:hypothetical protein